MFSNIIDAYTCAEAIGWAIPTDGTKSSYLKLTLKVIYHLKRQTTI